MPGAPSFSSRATLAIAASAALAACSSTQTEPLSPKLLSSSEPIVSVVDESGPLADALVQISAPNVAGELSPGVLWHSKTGVDGAIRAVYPLRPDQTELEVVVHKFGWDGPWTDAATHAAQGIHAPSSRQIVAVDRVDGLTVTLARRAQ